MVNEARRQQCRADCIAMGGSREFCNTLSDLRRDSLLETRKLINNLLRNTPPNAIGRQINEINEGGSQRSSRRGSSQSTINSSIGSESDYSRRGSVNSSVRGIDGSVISSAPAARYEYSRRGSVDSSGRRGSSQSTINSSIGSESDYSRRGSVNSSVRGIDGSVISSAPAARYEYSRRGSVDSSVRGIDGSVISSAPAARYEYGGGPPVRRNLPANVDEDMISIRNTPNGKVATMNCARGAIPDYERKRCVAPPLYNTPCHAPNVYDPYSGDCLTSDVARNKTYLGMRWDANASKPTNYGVMLPKISPWDYLKSLNPIES